MKYLMFMNRWEWMIRHDWKDTTIRPRRLGKEFRLKPGDDVSLRVWTSRPYRSKQREICQRRVKFVFAVRITRAKIHRPDIKSNLSRNKVARADGFESWPEMRDFFAEHRGLPFDGWLVHWTEAAS